MEQTRHTETNLLMHNQKLTVEIQRRVDQLAAINTVAAVVSQSLDLNATLQTAMDAVLSVISVEASGISLIDERAGELVLRAQRGWKKDFVTTPMRIKLGHGMSGHVIATNEVVVTGDVSKDPRLVVPAVAEENIQAMAMAPMHARGKLIGVLSVMSYRPYDFDEQEISVLRAIADQVGVALDNAQLYETAHNQQMRLQAVLQSTADAIIATDENGVINLFNDAAERLFALRADETLGQTLGSIALPAELQSGLGRALAERADETMRHFDFALDTGYFLSAVISPVSAYPHLMGESKNGWVIVFQDITYLKEAERARIHFIQTAAHDLRNPLGVTLSALTMLQKSWKEPTALDKEVFGIALRGVNRMQDLIDDLMHLEKIESGVDLRREPIDMAALIENCAQDIGPSLADHDQHLQLHIASDLPPLVGDAGWMMRALANLLNNAHKYTPDGGQIVVSAYAEADPDGGHMVIAIQDDGPGIPLEAQGRLFERFYRVRQAENKAQGTGLGLAIVKSVAEKHQGYVTVQSAPGQGSTFTMVLPLQVPHAQ